MTIKKIITLILLILYASSVYSVHVRGYFRKNRTYVIPHYRSSPHHHMFNNWSPNEKNQQEMTSPTQINNNDNDRKIHTDSPQDNNFHRWNIYY